MTQEEIRAAIAALDEKIDQDWWFDIYGDYEGSPEQARITKLMEERNELHKQIVI